MNRSNPVRKLRAIIIDGANRTWMGLHIPELQNTYFHYKVHTLVDELHNRKPAPPPTYVIV